MTGLLGNLFGSSIGDIFGGGSDAGSYLGQIPSAVKPYLQPYSKAGEAELSPLSKQYGSLLSDPGEMLNKIGEQYKQSPGLNFAIQQAMRGAGHAAAAGGMAGSPEAQQQSQEIATRLGEQDYYNWLNRATGMYGQGLSGMQNLAGMGLEAGSSLAQALGQALSAQAQAAQEQQATQASNMGGLMSTIASLASNF